MAECTALCGDIERDRDELQAENERLRGLLDEVLATFTEHGHPGSPCLRTGWHTVERVEAWREAASR